MGLLLGDGAVVEVAEPPPQRHSHDRPEHPQIYDPRCCPKAVDVDAEDAEDLIPLIAVRLFLRGFSLLPPHLHFLIELLYELYDVLLVGRQAVDVMRRLGVVEPIEQVEQGRGVEVALLAEELHKGRGTIWASSTEMDGRHRSTAIAYILLIYLD